MPISSQEYGQAFLEQAREDLKAAHALPIQTAPSTFCMLLQMVFEKLGKAAYLLNGQHVAESHVAISKLFVVLKRAPKSMYIPTVTPDVEQFIRDLENAQPSNAKARTLEYHGNNVFQQLEYPWKDELNNQACYPARDLTLAQEIVRPRNTIASQCLKFASALEKDLNKIATMSPPRGHKISKRS